MMREARRKVPRTTRAVEMPSMTREVVRRRVRVSSKARNDSARKGKDKPSAKRCTRVETNRNKNRIWVASRAMRCRIWTR